jgi:DNA repair protein RadC
MPMKDLPAEQRPREKLLARGPAAWPTWSCWRCCCAPGCPGQRRVRAGRRRCCRLRRLCRPAAAPTPADLLRIKGLGPAKRAEIAAVMEMARRALAQQLREAPVFDSPQKVKDYLALHLGGRTQEVFTVLFLDGQHRLLHGGDVPRHADADQRLPARGGAPGAARTTPAP